MVTRTDVNMIFLGTFADVDTNEEENTAAENAAALRGTYENLTLTRVRETDADDDGAIRDNEAQVDPDNPDFLSYDVGFGRESYQIDSTISYTARLLLGDGTTLDMTVAVIQTTIGDVFIRDLGNNLDNLNIQSIQLVSVANNNFSGSTTRNSVENTEFVCFGTGTLIATTSGLCKVEDLRLGMMVDTLDYGPRPVRWIGSGTIGGDCISIAPGAMGPGLPRRQLRLSQQHRLLVRSRIAQRMTGHEELLLPAKRFTAAPGITQGAMPGLRFWHILLDCHAVIEAEGLPVESLYPGDQVFRTLSDVQAESLEDALADRDGPERFARPVPPGHVQRRLVQRHLKNGVPFCTPANAAVTAA